MYCRSASACFWPWRSEEPSALNGESGREPLACAPTCCCASGPPLPCWSAQYIYASYGVGDPARLSAQVISGIGFLGAGTIIVTRRNQIKGLTTAATLWATACMGLAVGVGFYECALAMYVILIFILLLVNVVDTKYLKIPTSTALYLEVRRDVGLGNAIHFIHEIGWSVREVKEFPSGRPDILAVRLDLESEQAMRGDISTMVLLKEQEGVVRLEM